MTMWVRLKAKKWRLIVAALVVGVAGYVSKQFLMPGENVPSPALTPSLSVAHGTSKAIRPASPHATPVASDMKAAIDPKTGRLQKPSPGEFSEGQQEDPLLTEMRKEQEAPRKLRELLSPVAGGGVVTNVRLRFRRPLVATKDTDGKLTIQHAPQAADVAGEQ